MPKDNDKHPEEKVTGGRVTPGLVRVANTIRRPTGPHSQFVHTLLQHLKKNGFDAAPRFLGIDGSGREILSFIEGKVPADLSEWSTLQLQQAGQLIRRFHDATRGMAIAEPNEVICHNDLSPCNFVFQDNSPIALIDFDAAAPGLAISDLAYALWMWCNLGDEDRNPTEKGILLKIMCDSYGLKNRTGVIAAIMKRQQENIISCQRNVEKGLLEWQAAVDWSKKCLIWVEKNQIILQQSL